MRFFAIVGFSYLISLMVANIVPIWQLLSFFYICLFILSCICCYVSCLIFYDTSFKTDLFVKENNNLIIKILKKKIRGCYLSFIKKLIIDSSKIKDFLLSIILGYSKIEKVLITICFSGIMAILVSGINYKWNIYPVANLDDKDFTVTGSMVELPSKSESGVYHYIFKVKYIHGMDYPKNFKIAMSSSNPIDADIYDEFTGDIHIFLPHDAPEFPTRSFYKAKGIYANAFLYDYKPTKVTPIIGIKPLYYYALRLRSQIILAIYSLFPERQAAIISGILLGNKIGIPIDIKSSFDNIGVSYLLAVSGVHVTIFVNMFLMIFKKMNINKRKASLITAGLVFAFMAVSCFTPSVLRAGIMCIVYLLSGIFSRKSDSINSLGLSAFIISVLNPDAGGDIGLWLSLCSALGILILVPHLKAYFFKKNNISENHLDIFSEYIINSAFVTLSATIFTFPIIAFYFKKFSIISVLSDLMLIFPVTVMIFLIIPLIFLYIFNMPKFLIFPLKLISGIIANYIIACSEILSKIPFSWVCLNKDITILWILLNIVFVLEWYAIFYFFKNVKFEFKENSQNNIDTDIKLKTDFHVKSNINSEIKLKKLNIKKINIKNFLPKTSLLPIFFICSFSALFILHKVFMKNLTRISVINAGKGCSMLCTKDNSASLILCLNEKSHKHRILSYLYNIGIKNINNLIVINPEFSGEEHIVFLNRVIDVFKPENIIFTSQKSENYISNMHKNIKFINKNFKIQILEDLQMNFKKINETRMIFFKIKDINIMVCPFGGEAKDIYSEKSDCDVFVAGGIPSDYNGINSLYTILSMPKRSSDIVIPKIKNVSENLLSTAEEGTINIDISKSGMLSVRAGS